MKLDTEKEWFMKSAEIEGDAEVGAGIFQTPSQSSIPLLEQGLYVVETRHRKQNKDLGPWVFDSAFSNVGNAEWYYYQLKDIGYARIFYPKDHNE